MDTKPHQAAIRAAEKIAESFSVGTFAKTAELDFTPADPSDIAQIITREYEPVVSALRQLVKDTEQLRVEAHQIKRKTKADTMMIVCATQFKEKAEKALQQLTKE